MTSAARWSWQWDRDLFSDEEISQRQGQLALLVVVSLLAVGGLTWAAFTYG